MSSTCNMKFYGNAVDKGYNLPPHTAITACSVAGVARTYTEPNTYRILLDGAVPSRSEQISITFTQIGVA